MGIEPINPFELPLLNTVLLLSSGVTVTWAHHAVISGNRKGALAGAFSTVLLAIVFLLFQVVEYKTSGFTISDGAFGSCFYLSTGFHGLTLVAPPNLLIFIPEGLALTFLCNKKECNKKECEAAGWKYLTIKSFSACFATWHEEDKMCNQIKSSAAYLTVESNKKSIKLNKNFIGWLVGFTDAEGNFNISLKGLQGNRYNSLILTFQIGLHIDDLYILEYIKDKLNCGNISKSGDRCNYFVNDQKSLINVVLPIFNYVELKSSKYHQYLVFEKAVKLLINKKHLTPQGRLEILEHYKNMKIVNINSTARENTEIDPYWLVGFTEGDGSFSTNKLVPRLKYENHIKEYELFKSILNYFKTGNLSKINRYSTEFVILEINSIHVLVNTVLPLFSTRHIMLTKKSLDFFDWSNIVKIYYYGYHTLSEGIELINLIKSYMNNYRLSTNSPIEYDKNIVEEKLNYLFSLPSPYEIKDEIRFIRGTDKLVSEKLKIIVKDAKGNIQYFKSITDCSLNMNIGLYSEIIQKNN